MDFRQIEQLVAAANGENEHDAAVAFVREQPNPSILLERLSRSTDVNVRGFVAAAAADVAGHDAVRLLTDLLEDSDPDVRVLALSSLEEIDPTALTGLLRRLRRRIHSPNPSEALATSWTLAKLGDADSVPLLESYRDSFEPSHWQHMAAEVVLLMMTDPKDVVRRVRDHDHDRMLWLGYAAKLIGTPEAISALRECSANAPDAECRGKCAYQLEHDDGT